MFACPPAGPVRVLDKRIELDGDPPVVPDALKRGEYFFKVDRSVPGDQVMMHARGGNVLDVHVVRVRREPLDRFGQRLTDAIEMTDVEIQSHVRRVDSFAQLEKLGNVLDEQPRLETARL